MEVRTALGNYTGISEAAPDSADGEMATVQFAGDASATTALHDGYIYVLSNSELRIPARRRGQHDAAQYAGYFIGNVLGGFL